MSGGRDEVTDLAGLAESGLLAASLFHEIRQPLFVLKGLVDLAIEGRLALGPAELLVLRQELEHVEALVTHYGAREPRPERPTPMDLAAAVRVAVEALGPRARQAGVALTASYGAPVGVVARPIAVRQVVLNLVTNAIDAAQDHGRTVEVAVRRHDVADASWAEIEVVDSGPGIDPAVVDRLGQPFVTTKPAGKGTGLGLFVTRKLVEEWGGEIELGAASPGPGARVSVRIPAA